MSEPIVLFCKSYRTDLNRIVRLARSIAQFNVEKIPFYLSVPKEDVVLFKTHLVDFDVEIMDDDCIIQHNPQLDLEKIKSLPGHISQQIVKSEFWRLGVSEAYLCLDSDAFFIRPFRTSDFLWGSNLPYTVMDESHDVLESALSSGKADVVGDFQQECAKTQSLFDRNGKAYAFGPFPVVWHKDVWKSLETEFLAPRKMNLMDAILLAPLESRWYGEALLRYQAIPLMPCQALFKVYHYAWQLDKDRRAKVGFDQLAQLYCGVIYQSAWEREQDWPNEGGSVLSHLARRIKRLMGKV